MALWLKAVDQQQLQDLAKVVGVWCAVVPENSVLVTPPGYLVAVKPLNNKQVWGLRRSFMVNVPNAMADMKTMHELHSHPALAEDAKRLQEVMDCATA
jgi:hypothetical protein